MIRKLAILSLVGLVGCATTQDIQTPVLAPLAPVPVPSVAPLVLNPVKFNVMNSADVQNLAAQLKTSAKDEVFFTLDETDYKNLLLNLNSIDSYIQQETAAMLLLETINQERASETNVPGK